MSRSELAVRVAAGALGALAACACVAGPEWAETSDAGDLPGGAQIPSGTGPLEMITGRLNGGGLLLGPGDFQDMYLIRVTSASAFTATTIVPAGGPGFNTILWLFSANGMGLLANDENPMMSLFSALGPMSTDGTGISITEGDYYLAISGFSSVPVDAMGDPLFALATFGEVSGPDGPGGADPIAGWSAPGETGFYEISLSGVSFVPAPGPTTLFAAAVFAAAARRRR